MIAGQAGGLAGEIPAAEISRRTRAQCEADPRVLAALTYGSLPQGLGDRYSDAEFWIFLAEDAVAGWDAAAWIGRIGDPLLVLRNEFGAHVAVFENLVRGEFHFVPASDVDVVRQWPGRSIPVADMVLVDDGTGLTAALAAVPDHPAVPGEATSPDSVADLCGRFANWWVLGHNVRCRGEWERAVDTLAHVRRHLLWMLRLRYAETGHWLTPSRRAEVDLPAQELRELRELSPGRDADSLQAAYAAAWRIGSRLWSDLQPPGPPSGLTAAAAAAAAGRAVGTDS